ncbi:MAG: protein-tyrosine-phosphatase [Bacteroidota bacterium]
MNLFTSITTRVKEAHALPVSDERRTVLQFVIDYVQAKLEGNESVNLGFICTHNSRRSQLGQIWAAVVAYSFGIEINSFSAGVEETAFNSRAVASLRRFGFQVRDQGTGNPHYRIKYARDAPPLLCFSKTLDYADSPKDKFAAIMTCADADDNCPLMPGAEVRIPLRYDDPKVFDGTRYESEKYDERSLQIASEMLYVFSQVSGR